MAKKDRKAPEINASSMADIAFLLLIFFLVTTTIETDKGILHKLPPWDPNPPPIIEQNRRNTFVVLINAQDYLLVNNEFTRVDALRKKAKEFIDNNGRNPKLSDNPEIAVISLQNDRGTSYNMYIQVQNELKAAYRELRDSYALGRYGKVYQDLTKDQAKEVAEKYPMRLSEAEPKALGEGS